MTTGYTLNFSEEFQKPFIMFLNDVIIFDLESVKSVGKPN